MKLKAQNPNYGCLFSWGIWTLDLTRRREAIAERGLTFELWILDFYRVVPFGKSDHYIAYS